MKKISKEQPDFFEFSKENLINVENEIKKYPKSRKERFSSRQKQIELAKSRGVEHFGPQHRK